MNENKLDNVNVENAEFVKILFPRSYAAYVLYQQGEITKEELEKIIDEEVRKVAGKSHRLKRFFLSLGWMPKTASLALLALIPAVGSAEVLSVFRGLQLTAQGDVIGGAAAFSMAAAVGIGAWGVGKNFFTAGKNIKEGKWAKGIAKIALSAVAMPIIAKAFLDTSYHGSEWQAYTLLIALFSGIPGAIDGSKKAMEYIQDREKYREWLKLRRKYLKEAEKMNPREAKTQLRRIFNL